ncbi:MAG: DoxX family protein [Gemmatimonadota bacterium]|nr:DoxX family protein [Gemmatimonadota bacterium]
MTMIEPGTQSSGKLWARRVLTALPVLFLLFDVVIHFMKPAVVVTGFEQLGWSASLSVPLAIVELVCLVLYLIPRASVLGAVLLTGYLGGAVATNLRVGAPMFTNILFPVYVGLFLWGGLYLRDAGLRAVFPVRK